MKSYGTLVGELPTGIEFVVEGALLRIYFDFERREAVQKAGSEDVVVEWKIHSPLPPSVHFKVIPQIHSKVTP